MLTHRAGIQKNVSDWDAFSSKEIKKSLYVKPKKAVFLKKEVIDDNIYDEIDKMEDYGRLKDEN